MLNPFLPFATEIDTSSEHAQFPSEATVVMEPISMKDSVGSNSDATSTDEECLETAEESRSEETGSNVEFQSNEPDMESVVDDEKMAGNNELESNEAEEENVTGDATPDHVNEDSGVEESVSLARTAHDFDAIKTSADILTPQCEAFIQPAELSCEKSGYQIGKIDETPTHEEKVEEGENDSSVQNNAQSKQNELTKSTMATVVTPVTLPSTTGTENNLVVEEGQCRDKEKFCESLRYLKDLALPDVLRDLSSEEIFEAHHNLTEITSVVVQALRGRWQSPRSKK